jgi:transglutaminase-like putative cysteine protease
MEKSPSRWWDPLSAILFIFATILAAWRLSSTDWTEHLGYVTSLALTGAMVGLALGASKFKKRGALWLALAYTLVFIPRQLLGYYDDDIYLGERLASVGGRLLFSISEFTVNRPVKDPMFFIFLIGTLFWLMALISGYQLTRRNNSLAAILPFGLAMLVIHHFDPSGRAWLISLYLILALTLLARGKYLRDRVSWDERGVHVAPETGPDLAVGALIGAAALIVLAWNLPLDLSRVPTLEEKWREFSRPWRGTRDRLGRAFDALESESTGVPAEYFNSSMSLGTSATQGSDLVMIASIPPEALELPRIYWRARVYDQYANGAWTESQFAKNKFTPEVEEYPIPDRDQRLAYEFTLRSYTQGQAILSLPAQPLWVSRPVDVTLVNLANGEQDILAIETFPFLEPGEAYRVRSAMIDPSIEELMAAGEEYPDWVTARYLQLPENFSDRIRGFASQVTFGLETPYEKAQALTTVLRAQIEYQPSILPPPEGTDPLEWFLFDLKQGYCNYYATTEVLMLRAVGVPARMVVGFAQGEIVEGAQRPGELEGGVQEYSITRKHTHAWPEVYFPGIGWVEFEPTVNQDPIARPETHQTDDEPGAPPFGEPTPGPNLPNIPLEELPNLPTTQGAQTQWLAWLMWLGILALVAVGIYFANQRFALTTRAAQYVLAVSDKRGEGRRTWARSAALYVLANPFERAFHPINQSLRRLGHAPASHHTPAERATALSAILPDAATDIETLLKEYEGAQYSPRGGDIIQARRASRRVLWLGWRTSILAVWERIRARW